MHNTTTAAGRPSGPFHKIGLSFGSAGAIVRLTADDKIMSVVASWVRTRRGDTDKIFLTTPEQLLGAPEGIVQCITLQGDAQKKRHDVILAPEDRICMMLEGVTNGGSYAVIYMDRVGQSPEFLSMMYRLDSDWRMDKKTARPIATLTNWLHEDFLDHARDIPSAWPIMYASASLFGGQDPAEMPPSPPELPADLAEACEAERRFRASQRRARALSPEQREAFRQKLSADQAEAFDSLMEGKRTHV